ncbi:hypothetical protein GCK72_019943 [Caenorhabditis remanei]|uniref:G-protein coupled receptors family 1 profile domain-containing protein n=1 Tax=Caenorhabditis remanei TaxID=31234 RepID=A0A6A5GFA8_CAERE|nr:hypothetical protein GCK72_019943 [Caenorhabditis remanei]KAF1753386.1 hypothetical protein GCK72_019943 [Caenorhabditis remanei]
MNFTSSFSDNSTILTTTVSYSNLQSSTVVSKDIVKYVELPDWFNDAFNMFNFILAILQFIAFGINLIHMTILTRKELRSNTIYRLMIGICVCDLISQVLSFISFSPFWIRSIKKGEECYVTVTYQDAIINKYVVGVLDDTQRSATWLGLLMALYRVLAVMFPMSPSIQRVSKRAYVPVIVVVVLLLNGMVSSAAMWNHEIYRQLKDFRTIAYLIMCFAEIFPVVNSSTHLFVCFFMSSQYRETAKSMLGRPNQKIIFVEECKTHTITKAASKSL